MVLFPSRSFSSLPFFTLLPSGLMSSASSFKTLSFLVLRPPIGPCGRRVLRSRRVEKILLINADEPEEVRVALLEDGRVEELYVEAGTDPTAKGNVYVGRVQNVEKGIGAAFVELGPGLTGFLHASDIARPVDPTGGAGAADDEGDEDDDLPAVGLDGLPVGPDTEAPPPAPAPESGTGDDDPAVAAPPPSASRTVTAEADPSSGSEGGPESEGAPAAGGPGPEADGPVEAHAAAEPSDLAADTTEVGGTTQEIGGNTTARRRRGRPPPRPITDLVKPGDLLLVQITRGPIGNKGPALTTRISLPGRYVVLLANSRRGGVSRRIESGEGRDRMRSILSGLSIPAGMAAILRTASGGRTLEEVQADVDALGGLFESMKQRLKEGGGPRLVHAESDLVLRALRDVLPSDATRLVVDDPDAAARVREVLERMRPPASAAPPSSRRRRADREPPSIGPEADPETPPDADPAAAGEPPAGEAPGGVGAEASVPAEPPTNGEAPPAAAPVSLASILAVHDGASPLFHHYGVETQVEDAYRRTIRLPSGGSIVIDPTEALVAIDVNSGRMTEEEDLEATALKTDLEAVPEIARQLRLRDLGGVIVIDFIDLRQSSHGHQVEQALREALKRDRARIRLGRMGPFGCLELTRQRIRPTLASVTHVPCAACAGTGRRRHPVGLALRVLREIRARAARARFTGGLEVRVAPPILDVLRKRKGQALHEMERAMKGPFRIYADPAIAQAGWAIKGIPPKAPGGTPAVPAGEPAPGTPPRPGPSGSRR